MENYLYIYFNTGYKCSPKAIIIALLLKPFSFSKLFESHLFCFYCFLQIITGTGTGQWQIYSNGKIKRQKKYAGFLFQ